MIAAFLGVLGLVTLGLSVASATAWRADDTLVVSAPASGSGTLVVTAPGVLEMGGSPVTVTARAHGGSKVVLAIGREHDVTAWVGADPHTVLTGLASLHAMTTTSVGAEPATAGPAPDPEGSDMWIEQATGVRTAKLTWTPVAGRWTVLAAGAGDGAAAPTVMLSWPQAVSTPWLVPGVGVGSILLLLGLAWGLRLWLQARRGGPDWHRTDTGAVPDLATAGGSMRESGAAIAPDPGLDDAPTMILTRRQMRAAAAPAPRTAPRLTLRLRGEGGERGARASSLPRTGAPAPDPAAPVAGVPAVAPAPVGTDAPTDADAPAVGAPTLTPAPIEDAPVRSRFSAGGWIPRRPSTTKAGPSTEAADGDPAAPTTPEPAAPTTPEPAAPAARALPVPPVPAVKPPAAPGSRADAWRRAWGFPGEAATGPDDPVGPDADADADPPDQAQPRKDTP